MASWQENLNSRGARLSHIFSSGDMSDVTFVVGVPPEQKRFKVHKLILSMSSDVFFFIMSYGSLPENGEVEVPDIQPDIFEIVMKYVYEDSFSVQTVEQAMYTYCASEKYNISHLRALCAAYITDNLSPENLPILYRMPVLLETLHIKSKCKTMLSENALDVLTSENFAKAPLDMVKDIVQLEDLNVSSEKHLFELVLEWAKSFCSQGNAEYTTKALREIMDHFLPHIRFLVMSGDSFLLGPASCGILTDSEVASISQNLVVPGFRKLPVWCNRGKSRHRQCLFPLMESHDCLSTEWVSNSIECRISILSGKVLFKGVIVYVPSISILPTTSFRMKIDERTIFIATKCSYDTETSLLKCVLLKPFPLSLSKVYDICVSSNRYIFSQCGLLHSETSVKRNQDFEMEYTLLVNTYRSKHNDFRYQPGIHSGCAYFYEIIYS